MLEGLDDIEWDQLTHAYGEAGGIPARIRALRSTDPAVWVRAMSDLYDALCHQMCSIYPATVPAIPFLIELLSDPDVCCRGRILGFLADVTFVANDMPEDKDDFDEEHFPDELQQQTREAVWQGFEIYLELLSDLDQRIRVMVPYLLGAMVNGDLPADAPARIKSRMQSRFGEEPNELVRASLVFGLACFFHHDSTLKEWLEQQAADPDSSPAVKMAAALNLAEVETSVSDSVQEVLAQGLEHPDVTNQVFKADQPTMEERHHPIGRAMLEYEGRLTQEDDNGRAEDMKFPWCERWQSGWVSWRILEMLTELKVENTDRFVPVLTPFLDRADEYTGDSIVIPILKSVFGDRKLSPDTTPANLSESERTVLLHLFNNLKLWATNMNQQMFSATGLGNRRTDWARVLGTDPGFSDHQILEILRQKMKDQRHSSPEDVQEIRLCRIGSGRFLPHLKAFPNLKILDFADTSLGDIELKEVSEFTELRQLRLNNAPVTDEGVQQLSALSNLEELYLWGTDVTNKCLESLGQLPKLKYVSLSNTSVTKAAAREFMEEHPMCRISL